MSRTIPSHQDVSTKFAELLRQRHPIASVVVSRSVTDVGSLFVVDFGRPYGIRAQYVDLDRIFLMLAQHMDYPSSVFTVADAILEPSDDWVLVDPTDETLLTESSEDSLGAYLESRRRAN